MDFNQFNTRAHAEAGTPMQIVDPWTGEPMMDGDKPCRVIVRGTASKSVQAAMRAKAKAAMMSKKAKGDDADEEARVMEDVHMQPRSSSGSRTSRTATSPRLPMTRCGSST